MTVRKQLDLADVQGVWRRLWLSAPNHHDTTTRVSWIQGGSLHVDVRLPADLPDVAGARALADLDAASLYALAECEGFAGKTGLKAGTCTWQREINYRGPLDGPDIGTLEVTDEGVLETGVHASYCELWQHCEPGPAQGLRVELDGQVAVLVWTRTTFGLGRASPAALLAPRPFRKQLANALETADRATLARLFDQEFCFGQIQDGIGLIRQSTNPTRVGDVAVEIMDPAAPDPPIVLYRTEFSGNATSIALQ